jgi:hypothetical protein
MMKTTDEILFNLIEVLEDQVFPMKREVFVYKLSKVKGDLESKILSDSMGDCE